MNMSDGDASWLQWIIGGLAAITAAVGAWGWSVLNNQIKAHGEDLHDHGTKLDREIADNVNERRRLWERIDLMVREMTANRHTDYQVFASKEDISRLQDNIGNMLASHERHVRDLIANRPPIRQDIA